jgi:A/G-specific adenine glycosylase
MLSAVPPDAATVRASLLPWFRRHARPLPWRKSKSAYRIWLSEIMLQQTQISTVIPYYLRFLKAFPSVERLAEAPSERVLELWSGMGYYRRARNLHGAAKILTQKYRGRFPADFKLALGLPGVGDYTARAVLSIAYNQPYTLIDGNVTRVMARFLALRGNPGRSAFRRALEQELGRLLSRRRAGNFNQAMMELGETICLPRLPRCPACPLRRWCRAFAAGQPEAYPAPKRRRAAEQWHLATGVLKSGGRYLMVRGLDEGLLDGLWNFPAALGKTPAESLRRLQEKLHRTLPDEISLRAPSHQLRHNITYRSIEVDLYKGELPAQLQGKDSRWMTRTEINRSAVSQLSRKVARYLGDPA